MATLATLITQTRTLARDTPKSNRSPAETPKPQDDGTGTRFRLQNPILITGSVYWSDSSHFHVTTGVTINDANAALITISPAPASGFVVDYYFNWFEDADYTEFLNDAARDLLAVSDPTTVADGLISALLQYALGYFYQARMTQYLHRYSSSGGQAGQSVSSVSQGFAKAADMAFKKAGELRDDFYKDLGQREKAATAVAQFQIDPITPPR